jgi:hypothetical protein
VGRLEQQRLMSALDSLRGVVELVIVDAGAGAGALTRRLWARAALVVLVTTTDGAAVLDSYALLKRSVVDASGPPVRFLVNQCNDQQRAAEAQRRCSCACERFLRRTVNALPPLPQWHGSEDGGRKVFAGGSTANKFAVAPKSWPRVWEMADSEFGRAMLWLGRAVGDALRIGDAGCRVPEPVASISPTSSIRHPASC